MTAEELRAAILAKRGPRERRQLARQLTAAHCQEAAALGATAETAGLLLLGGKVIAVWANLSRQPADPGKAPDSPQDDGLFVTHCLPLGGSAAPAGNWPARLLAELAARSQAVPLPGQLSYLPESLDQVANEISALAWRYGGKDRKAAAARLRQLAWCAFQAGQDWEAWQVSALGECAALGRKRRAVSRRTGAKMHADAAAVTASVRKVFLDLWRGELANGNKPKKSALVQELSMRYSRAASAVWSDIRGLPTRKGGV